MPDPSAKASGNFALSELPIFVLQCFVLPFDVVFYNASTQTICIIFNFDCYGIPRET